MKGKTIILKSIKTFIDVESDYYAIVVVEYDNVVIELINNLLDEGFTITNRNGYYCDKKTHITSLLCIENKVYLKTDIPYCDFYSINDCYISYKRKVNCIVDKANSCLPEINGVRLMGNVIISEYIERIEVSDCLLFNNGNLKNICFPNNISYSVQCFSKCIIELPEEAIADKTNNFLIYYRFKYIINQGMKINLRIHSGASFKIWENNVEIACEAYKSNIYNKHLLKYKLTPIDGENEIVLAVETNYGDTKGFAFQFEVSNNIDNFFWPELI